LASVFPHRELAVQKPWMHHEMKKPRELSFWKLAPAAHIYITQWLPLVVYV
jgi:hypothetical protein